MRQFPYPLITPSDRRSEFLGKCALAVMAKVPQPGRVKTRLSPPLSAAQCADVNIAFLKDTLACLQSVSERVPAITVVSYTPAGEESGFCGIVPEATYLVAQREGDFGTRLSGTVDSLLTAGFKAVCLIDSDSPTVPEVAYESAARTLVEANRRCAVLGASADGGYYALGMNSYEPYLFHDIPWSTGRVAEETRRRSSKVGLPLHELPEWYDVDDSQSFIRLKEELTGPPDSGGHRASHTRAMLTKILRELPTAWEGMH